MSDLNGIDVDKLEFKQQYLEAGRITVRAKNQKMYPISREAIIKSLKAGHHTQRIPIWFTPESIEAAKKKANSTSKPKSKPEK